MNKFIILIIIICLSLFGYSQMKILSVDTNNGVINYTNNISINGSAILTSDPFNISSNLYGIGYPITTVMITRANNSYISFNATNTIYIDFDTASYPTNGVAFVELGLYAGANIISFNTNIISTNNLQSLPFSTNDWTSIIFHKMYGSTNWVAR